MSDTKTPEKFDSWALVEVMGHQQFAGRVSEVSIAGAGFLRVDVPEQPVPLGWKLNRIPAFTKFLSPGSIFSLTPCTEAVARAAAAQMRSAPVSCVDLPNAPPALPAPAEYPDDAPEDSDYDSEWDGRDDGTDL